MADKKYRGVTVIDDSCSSSSYRKGTSFRPVPCVKNIEEMKKFEEAEEDCFILDFDPDDDLNFSKLSISENDANVDFYLVAEKGKVTLRDFPHSRHSCAKLQFEKTTHDSHCELCYCYVCDLPAPCQKWVGNPSHCHAFDDEKWNSLRRLYRKLQKLKKKIECAEFEFENTSHGTESKPPIPGASRSSTSSNASASSLESASSIETQQEEQHNFNPGGGERSYQRSQETQIYVGNLSYDITNEELRELFMGAGVVTMCRILRRYAFVTMRSAEEAEKAVRMFHGFELEDRVLTVRKATPRRGDTYKVHVSNLSGAVNDEVLELVFQGGGFKVMSARVVLDWETRRSRHYGFVELLSEADREKAISKLNGFILDGMEMLVKRAF